MTDLDKLAQKLRAEALSGYAWNVAKTWDEVNDWAKNVWRQRAAEEIEKLKGQSTAHEPICHQ